MAAPRSSHHCARCSAPYVGPPEVSVADSRCSLCGASDWVPDGEVNVPDARSPRPSPEVASPRRATSHSAPPAQLGRFEIRSRLGSGAFGAVYRAFDSILRREVALKIPHARIENSPQARARMEREPKAAAQLHHPYIVPVYDAGFEHDRFYIASAFIEGETLEARIRREPLDPRQAATIVRKLAEALHYAHRLGVVHRDVKPSNVILDPQGEPHLFDFGLARWKEAEDERLTTDGSLLGTPAYMSPEQAGAPVGAIGPASDQYGLAVVLYEMLCGEPPFTGSPLSVMHQIREGDPPALFRRKPTIPRDLAAVCHKALTREPENRYADCGRFAADLAHWLAGEPVAARRTGPLENARRWCRRNPALAVMAGAVAVLAVLSSIAAGGFYFARDDARRLAADAESNAAEARKNAAEARERFEALSKETAARSKAEKALGEREADAAAKAELLAKRETELQALDAQLKTRDVQLQTQTTQLQARSAELKAAEDRLAKSDSALKTTKSELTSVAEQRDAARQVAPIVAYAAKLAEARRLILANQKTQASAVLDTCSEPLRLWEWTYLKSLCTDGIRREWQHATTPAPPRQWGVDRRGASIVVVDGDGKIECLDAATGLDLPVTTVPGSTPPSGNICSNIVALESGQFFAVQSSAAGEASLIHIPTNDLEVRSVGKLIRGGRPLVLFDDDDVGAEGSVWAESFPLAFNPATMRVYRARSAASRRVEYVPWSPWPTKDSPDRYLGSVGVDRDAGPRGDKPGWSFSAGEKAIVVGQIERNVPAAQRPSTSALVVAPVEANLPVPVENTVVGFPPAVGARSKGLLVTGDRASFAFDGQAVSRLKTHEDDLAPLAFLSDGARLVAYDRKLKQTSVYEVVVGRSKWEPLLVLDQLMPMGEAWAIAEDGTAGVSFERVKGDGGKNSGSLRGWRIDNRAAKDGALVLRGHTAPVLGVEFAADGNHLLSYAANQIRYWNLAGGDLTTIDADARVFVRARLSPDMQRIYAADGANTIGILNAQNGRPISRLDSAGRHFVLTSDSQTIIWQVGTFFQVWDLRSGTDQLLRQFQVQMSGGTPLGVVQDVAIFPNGRFLAAAGSNNLRVFEISSGKISVSYFLPSACVACSSNGTVAAGGIDKLVYLYKTTNAGGFTTFGGVTRSTESTDSRILQGLDDPATSVAFSPDGGLVAAGGGKKIIVWNTSDRTKAGTFFVADTVSSVAFSPDGKRLATGSADHLIRIWKVND